MRRIIVYLLVVTGILTVIIGIAEAQAWHARAAVAHIVMASIFILTCIVHIIINRKAVIRYIRGVR